MEFYRDAILVSGHSALYRRSLRGADSIKIAPKPQLRGDAIWIRGEQSCHERGRIAWKNLAPSTRFASR